MTTTVSAGATLLNASSSLTLYANLYLAPMTQACLREISRLDSRMRQIDRQSIEAGLFEPVHWGFQPGGRPMFNFMLRVMRADAPESVPNPIPDDVARYLMRHRSGFNAGVGRRARNMPTTGLIFKDLDQERASSWIYYNRENIWSMLYGSTRVPPVI